MVGKNSKKEFELDNTGNKKIKLKPKNEWIKSAMSG